MSLLLALALGALLEELAVGRLAPAEPRGTVAGAATIMLWQPVLAIGVGLSLLVSRLRRRLASRRVAAEAADKDVAVLGELTALGLTAGMTLSASMALAATDVAPELSAEVEAVMRQSRFSGTARVMTTATGRAQRLYLLAGRAAATGAPVLSAVQAFVDEQRHADRNAALAAARKLPVRLMFPLALLILPGFVILIVGPTVLSTLSRLGM